MGDGEMSLLKEKWLKKKKKVQEPPESSNPRTPDVAQCFQDNGSALRWLRRVSLRQPRTCPS